MVAFVESLFRAYFTEGRDIGNRQALLHVVAEAGLARSNSMLNGDEGLHTIKDAAEQAQRLRVENVPFAFLHHQRKGFAVMYSTAGGVP
jgi:predicted DsbA family dithiol-disulfide isomerase